MKYTLYILPVAIVSLTMAVASVQAEDLPDNNARQHKLTTSLKVTYEGEEKTSEKNNGDETYVQKFVTAKISNKEILLVLVEDGVIADIKGWSIVLTTNDNAEITGTWITKKKNTPINISNYFDAASRGGSISSYKGKYTAKKNADSGNETTMDIAYLAMYTEPGELPVLDVRGILTADTSYSFDYDLDTGEDFIEKATFTDLSGVAMDGEGFVTGSIKAGKGKKFTVNFL